MNLLVIGGGGREHALCWALAASPLVDTLFCAPGNGGIEAVATCIALDSADFDAVVAFCRREAIDFVVVGPEAPLVGGIVDRLEREGIRAFGPSAAAARLEGSKGFTKELCARYNIPTAAFGRFVDAAPARAYARAHQAPMVIKADGLAAGKGVIIATTVGEAEAAIDAMFGGQFGDAGAEVIVEEFLAGEEASFFVLVDGENILPLTSAQDHKRLGDGDTGPNTGGMGACSPAPVMTPALTEAVMEQIIRPTVAAMKAEGAPFKGVLYAGLMIDETGPRLLEYNVRFGDPECEILMPLIESSVYDLFYKSATGDLVHLDIEIADKYAVGVVLASKDYPYKSSTPAEIIIDEVILEELKDKAHISFAGVTKEDGKLFATGGRVLVCVGIGDSIREARDLAYLMSGQVHFAGKKFRTDIAYQALRDG